ncbi:DUF1003 domain-containing protein [Pseudofrankia sp. BMG5.37]|uniref:DUF1003 domain-containing protein n=1 Tax=Pseudofrankia sp. BMG5.37 TaxID=3050035 RepID=UPI0028938CCA|nr:DUF1003 domain-containing protein [Pseudofrankia sp. BMG5.37]MDT3438473.1 DUF1003 domain-containing protein [Pseudofrankia sp. BMG5.37]
MSITTTANRVVSRRAAERLDIPVASRVALLPRPVNREAFSRGAERIARYLGTGRYLAIQTVLVIVWIGLNIAIPLMRWDPYPFILLNLAFSTQAAYAAPLILLAQNRQDDRDRAGLAEDRAAALRAREDTEFLAREVASLRLAQSDAATRQYLRGELAHQLDDLRDDLRGLVLEAVRATLSSPDPVPAGTGPRGKLDAALEPADALANGTQGRRGGRGADRATAGRGGGRRAGGERHRAVPGGQAVTAAMRVSRSTGCGSGGEPFGESDHAR